MAKLINQNWAILPAEEKPELVSDFIATPSNPVANNLSRVNDRFSLDVGYSDGSFQIEYNDLYLKATSKVLATLKPLTSKVLDILAAQLLRSSSLEASRSVSDIMKDLDISDRKWAKKALKDATIAACDVLIKYDIDKLPKYLQKEYESKELDFLHGSFKIAKWGRLTKDGVFTLCFTEDYAKFIRAYPPMLYRMELARIHDRDHPAAYYLGRKFTELVNTRLVKSKCPRSNKGQFSPIAVISIRKLIESAGRVIPSPEAVANSNRCFTARIIQPLERDLDALSTMGIWEYCRGSEDGGTPLSRSEADALPFTEWIELMVRFSFKGYMEELKRRDALRDFAKAQLQISDNSAEGAEEPVVDV